MQAFGRRVPKERNIRIAEQRVANVTTGHVVDVFCSLKRKMIQLVRVYLLGKVDALNFAQQFHVGLVS